MTLKTRSREQIILIPALKLFAAEAALEKVILQQFPKNVKLLIWKGEHVTLLSSVLSLFGFLLFATIVLAEFGEIIKGLNGHVYDILW